MMLSKHALRSASALALLACLAGSVPAADREVTAIEVTDKVIVPDTSRLGINTCGDNYWDSSIAKVRIAEDFEGVRYRMITWGPEQDENGLATWFSPPQVYDSEHTKQKRPSRPPNPPARSARFRRPFAFRERPPNAPLPQKRHGDCPVPAA